MKKLTLVALMSLSLVGTAIVSGCTSTNNQESTGQYMDSSAITLKVKSALLANKEMKSFPITVNTYKNGVQLSGYVDTAHQKVKAEQIARRVAGVNDVNNDLIVKPR